MSHNIRFETYHENCNRKAVQETWDSFVAHADYQEGATRLDPPIRWIEDPILNSYEEAEEFIRKNDKHWYDSLAVRFRDYGREANKPSRRIEYLHNKLTTLQYKLRDREEKLFCANRTSEFISCPHCHSKLARKYLTKNYCPVCSEDMRTKTELEAINRLKEQIGYTQKLLEEESKRPRKKKGDFTVRWLVKVEYHT